MSASSCKTRIQVSPALIVFGLLLLLSIWQSALAASFVWQVSKGQHTHYIGGTIHILSETDYPLPKSYETAYKQADTLVFEVDIDAMQGPVAQMKMLRAMAYPQGETVQQDIRLETFQALRQYFHRTAYPIDKVSRFKVSMIALFMMKIEFEKIGMTSQGVDHFYYQQAKKDGKKLGDLETLDEQIQFLADMGKGNEDDYLLNSLNDIEQFSSNLNKLRNAWRTGDTQTMEKLGIDEMKTDFPKVYASLMVERNQNWLPKISQKLQSDDTQFILVGAMHLVGEDGLLAALAKQGYALKQLP